jgi:hypothetical protein
VSVLDIFRINQIKAELEQVKSERDILKSSLADTDRMQVYELRQAIADLTLKKEQVLQEITALEAELPKRRRALDQQIADLNKQIEAKKKYLIIMDEEMLLQEFGFYKPKYDLQNSEQYKTRLDKIRREQEAMVKAGKATSSGIAWVVNNNKKEGERMTKDFVKLILRSFNNECDASIVSVKFSNVDSIEKRIRKAFDTLNNLGQRMTISISPDYLKLKLQELYLCYEYQAKKQEEKEEQKRIREQMREEAKLLKEIEELKFKLGKEERHFAKALQAVNAQLLKAQTEAERMLLETERASIQEKLAVIEKDKQNVWNREQNTRAGYVYIISNIGSFGEHIFKIGVTRRLDPQERIDELGDASVPFDFDIHALIFSDDAPALENALHKAFEKKRLNMINRRREFFNATLEEIEEVIRKNFKKPVEVIRLADAVEYRQSVTLREEHHPILQPSIA